MKSLILNGQLGFAANRLEAASGAVSRRNFLRGMGLVAGAMIASPALALPGLAYDGDSWKESVCSLVDYVCPEPTAGRIREAISRAETYYGPPPSDFHSKFSSRQIINAQVYPEATYGDRYFELARLPYYDSRNPCRRTKDLNVVEIEGILNGDEQEHYGGVVSPCSERRQLASCGCERDVYRKTLAVYEEDSQAWESLYVRNFTDGSSSYLGFAAKPRTSAQGYQLFLSPDSV